MEKRWEKFTDQNAAVQPQELQIQPGKRTLHVTKPGLPPETAGFRQASWQAPTLKGNLLATSFPANITGNPTEWLKLFCLEALLHVTQQGLHFPIECN